MEDDIIKIYRAETIDELCATLRDILLQRMPLLGIVIGFTPNTFRLAVYCHPPEWRAPADRYIEEDYRHDIWLRRSPVNPRVTAVRHSDYTPIGMLKRTIFYRRVLVPIGSLYAVSIVGWSGKRWLAMVTIHRSPAHGDFSDDEMKILRRLQPHFSAAVRRLAGEAEMQLRAQSIAAFVKNFPSAFILTRYDMAIIQYNDAAREVCHQLSLTALVARQEKLPPQPLLPDELISPLKALQKRIAASRPSPLKALSERVDSKKIEGLHYRISYVPERERRGMSEGLFLIVFQFTGKEVPPEFSLLTGREREVARLVIKGMSNGEIAGALNKSEATVKHQVASILQKLNLRGRFEIISLLQSRR